MAWFEELLLSLVTPRLQPYGYRYDDRLQRTGYKFYDQDWQAGRIPPDERIQYGFQKHLGQREYGFILVRRQILPNAQRATGYRFTVELQRHKPSSLKYWLNQVGGTRVIRRTNLGRVLWFVHHIPLAYVEHWWEPPTRDAVPVALTEATGWLIQYGIPWLAAPTAPPLDRLVEPMQEVFIDRVRAIMEPALLRYGYTLQIAPDKRYQWFVKPLWGSLNAFLLPLYGYDSNGEVGVGLLVSRNASPDPCYPPQEPDDLPRAVAEPCLEMGLGLLLNRVYGIPTSHLTLSRKYRTTAELDQLLQTLVTEIETYVLPWLENPDTTYWRNRADQAE
ncbi:MAG: hypothetical protein HC876_19945 [Chloroflexaceae bacterium]|nr:hypothetical protein [Chloroflexaceae bacterium]